MFGFISLINCFLSVEAFVLFPIQKVEVVQAYDKVVYNEQGGDNIVNIAYGND